jgi:GTPase Era involved in 16S rRNA processing
MIGRPGVGKSTLVNLLSNSKRSMEGKGASVTKYITRYVIDKYKISLYDSPGFDSNQNIQNIKYLIEKLNNHLIKAKN